MPLGFAGFPRDPTNGKPTGTAQSFLSSIKSFKDSKKSSASKAKEAEANANRESTDTLPVYTERASGSASQSGQGTQTHQQTIEWSPTAPDGSEKQQQSPPRVEPSTSSSKSPNSPMERTIEKVKAKMERKGKEHKGAEKLAGDEAEFQKMKDKEQERKKREEQDEKLSLDARTKFVVARAL